MKKLTLILISFIIFSSLIFSACGNDNRYKYSGVSVTYVDGMSSSHLEGLMYENDTTSKEELTLILKNKLIEKAKAEHYYNLTIILNEDGTCEFIRKDSISYSCTYEKREYDRIYITPNSEYIYNFEFANEYILYQNQIIYEYVIDLVIYRIYFK